MKISVDEFISLLKAFNKDNNGIVAIKTGTTEKTKPESFFNNQIVYGVGGEYIPEGEKDIAPTITGSGIRSGKSLSEYKKERIHTNNWQNKTIVMNISEEALEEMETIAKASAEAGQKASEHLKNIIWDWYSKTLNSRVKSTSDLEKENQELKSKITKLEGLHELLQASYQETIASYENKIKEHQDINYKLCEEKRKLEKENQLLKNLG